MDRQLNDNESTMVPAAPQGGKLLDRFRLLLEQKGWAPVMAEQHVKWVLGYILFHGKRHPRELGAAEARQYLDQVRATRGAKDQEQARAALLALYAELLGLRRNAIDIAVRNGAKPRRPASEWRDTGR